MNAFQADPTASTLVEQALRAGGSGDVEGAVALLRQAQAADARWHVPPYLLGAELAQAGRIDEAESAFATAVMLAPDFAPARFQLGLLQYSSQRIGIAMLTWQPLAQGTGDPALRLFIEGFAALVDDDLSLAASHFEAGIAANSANEPLNHDIRELVRHLAAHRVDASQDVQALLANYQRQGSLH